MPYIYYYLIILCFFSSHLSIFYVFFCIFCFFFFFSSRRRHTRCLSDWSSDVCSSDLMAVTLPLVSGCSVLLAERWDAAKAVDDIVRHRVTYSGGAAVFIQELVDAVDRSEERRVGKEGGSRGAASTYKIERARRRMSDK